MILILIATVDYRENYGYNIVGKNCCDPITLAIPIKKNSYRWPGTIVIDLVHRGDRRTQKLATMILVTFLAHRERLNSIEHRYRAEISRG